MIEQIIEAWNTNNRMNLLLLDALDSKSLNARPIAKREGRSVGQQLVHMNNVRYGWIEHGARDYLGKMKKLDKNARVTVSVLKKAFKESGEAIEKFLRDAAEGKVSLKGFKKSPLTFMCYLIAHDAHHRGQILIALKQSGMMVSQSVQFGIWEWDK